MYLKTLEERVIGADARWAPLSNIHIQCRLLYQNNVLIQSCYSKLTRNLFGHETGADKKGKYVHSMGQMLLLSTTRVVISSRAQSSLSLRALKVHSSRGTRQQKRRQNKKGLYKRCSQHISPTNCS